MQFSIEEFKNNFNEKKEKLIRILLNVINGFLIVFVTLLIMSFTNRVLISPPVDSALEENIEKLNNLEIIQVSILNSTSVNGLANKARTYLQMRNFDVVEIGNSKDILPQSIIIDRMGDFASAKKVAKAFGIADSLIKTDIDSSLFIRSSIVLGQDYPKLPFFTQ